MDASVSAGAWPTLASLGERRLISEVLGPRYRSAVSFGDDCAVVPHLPAGSFQLVATTDPCPEPLVASLGWKDPYYQGWLLGTINFSDLAAAGAEPLGLLVSYLLPEGLAVADLERIMDGVDDCCRAHGSQVIGGNLGDGSSIQLAATAIGACAPGKRLSRKGAREGDSILMVGSPGYLWGAALLREGHAHLPSAEEHAVFERALKPVAQLRAGRLLATAELAHAAIDVSDGLYASVQALCIDNGLGAVIDANAPVLDTLPEEICIQARVNPFAMAQLWGDWTLIAAVDGKAVGTTIETLQAANVSCHEIGAFQAGPEIILRQDGDAIAWHGIDAERFTESSWRRSKLSDYLNGLVGLRGNGIPKRET
jgi:thiamine-monophosphate kinase